MPCKLLYVIQVKGFLIKCSISWPYLISEVLVALWLLIGLALFLQPGCFCSAFNLQQTAMLTIYITTRFTPTISSKIMQDYCPNAVHKWVMEVIQASVGPTVDIKGSTQWKLHIDHSMEQDIDNKSAHSLPKKPSDETK